MNTSESTAVISAALAAAQAEMKNADLDSTNPHFKSRYASLASIRNAVIPVLAKNGIAVVQGTTVNGGENIEAFTRLTKDGEFFESTYPIALDKPQQMGSAITYAKRYMLSAMCAISAEEDDDGNAAQASEKAAPRATKPTNGNGQKPSPDALAKLYSAGDEKGVKAEEIRQWCESRFAAAPESLTRDAFRQAWDWVQGAGEVNEILSGE